MMIIEFLKTGRLGQLAIGSTKKQVADFLGPPTGRGNRMARGYDLWAYSDYVLEIGFKDDVVSWFGFNLIRKSNPAIPDAIGAARLPFNQMTTPKEFQQFLTENGIEFGICNEFSEQWPEILIFDVGDRVRAYFDREDGMLEKVMAWQ
jgi:hypothetical protein